MEKNSIQITDIKRILIGNAPPEFLIEVLIRTIIIYIFLLFIARLLGKRMSGQSTITEMAVMIMLGAMVAVPMQVPDRGIVQGIVILLCGLAFYRGINYIGFKNSRFENFTQGDVILLVKNGVVNIDQLRKSHLSRQELYALLRKKDIYQLGKVKRAYLEACGALSVYEEKNPRPGLPLLPEIDKHILEVQSFAGDTVTACCVCGNVVEGVGEDSRCLVCNGNEWTKAIN